MLLHFGTIIFRHVNGYNSANIPDIEKIPFVSATLWSVKDAEASMSNALHSLLYILFLNTTGSIYMTKKIKCVDLCMK